MAAVSLLGTPTINTTAGAKTVTATPAVGDLIVIVLQASKEAATSLTFSAPTDNNSSGTYTLVGTSSFYCTDNSTFRVYGAVYVRDSLIASASSTIFTMPAPVTDNGGGLAVLKITGMSKAGSSAIRQVKADYINATSTANPTTGTWGSARLTTNPVIGVVVNDKNPAGMTPTSGFSELLDTGYNSPTTGIEIQSRNSGDTGDMMAWTRATSYWACMGVELDASASLVTEELTAATFGFTSNSLTTKKTTNLGAASFGFATLNGQLSRTGQLYAGSLDFTNQPWQQHATNNQGAAALNFTAQNAEPTQVVTLTDAALSMSATDVTFARQNNLGVVAFDLVENVVYAGSRVDLDATQLKFAENDVVLGRTISLAAAALDMAPYGVAPTAVITLSTATVDNTALDITPSNAPLGTVVDLDTAALGFVVYDVSAGSEINLSLALLSFAMENQQNAAEVKLSAAALNLTAQDIAAVKDPVVIELTAAAFDFTEYALQAMGVSSIGDRRRILMGVGR